MEEMLHQLIGGLSHDFGFQPSNVVQDFFHPPYDIAINMGSKGMCPLIAICIPLTIFKGDFYCSRF